MITSERARKRCIFADDILVTLQKVDDTGMITLRTYTRRRGGSNRFFLSVAALRTWIDASIEENGLPKQTLTEMDLHSFAIFRLHKGNVRITIDWMYVDGFGDISGYQQHIAIPASMLRESPFAARLALSTLMLALEAFSCQS